MAPPQSIDKVASARRPFQGNQFARSIVVWLTLGVLFLLLFGLFSRTSHWTGETTVAFSDFLDQLDAGTVTQVTFQGRSLHWRTMHGDRLGTYLPFDPDLVKLLREKHVKISAEPEESDPLWLVALVQWFPLYVLVFIWITYEQRRQWKQRRTMPSVDGITD